MPGPDGSVRPRYALPTGAPLLGRGAELDRARDLLLGPGTRLLTLTGSGGTGKTSLGLALGETVLDEFADGVWFVDLSTIPAGESTLVWRAIAQALRLPDTSNSTDGSRIEVLEAVREHLADKRLLLVLDTFEHVLEAALSLAHLLDSCPGLKVLATSREPLHLRRERIVNVPPLGLPDLSLRATEEAMASAPSVRLFVERAQAVSPGFALDPTNVRAVAELCVRLGGLPLAIELAAARCRVLAPQALLERIRRQTSLLTSANRDVPERHRTLWATMAWSYDLLDERGQCVFRHLGTFAGSFDSEAAAAVCAPALESTESARAADVLDAMLVLADKSLLRTEQHPSGGMRFRLLDTVHEFALYQLRDAGEGDAAAARHARHYLDLAMRSGTEVPGPNEVMWLDRLEADYANLRRAIRWACTTDATDQALEACIALGLFSRLRGHSLEALEWIDYVLPHTEDVPPRLRAQALELAGRLGWSCGDRATGQARLRQSIALWRTLGDQRGLANALIELGMQEADRGHAVEAREALEESLGVYRTIGDTPGIAQALHGLGFRAEERGELDLASALLEEAVSLRYSVGHPSGLARSLNGLGIVARAQGDFERAESLHTQSLALYRELGHELGAAYTLAYLGRAAAQSGDTTRAAQLARNGLSLAWEQRNAWAMAESIDVLGILAARFGQYEQAARLLSAAEHLLGGTAPASSVARSEHDGALAAAREALGSSFMASWAAGQSLAMAGVVQQAFDVSDNLDQALPEPVPQQAGVTLSSRELEVAELVAAGLTNRDIAERLVISKWTADNHVANILRKLKLARRAQVATWLAEQRQPDVTPSS
jgi:predicted ATPase/DNA-binding CsgD family transcriptional regulator